MPRPKNILLRLGAVLAVGLGLALTVGAAAGAAGPEPVSGNELSKATTAAHSPTALSLLGKVPAGAAKTAATVSPDTHAVYALNPAFVRDASAPVATFWYAATPASKGGQALTVYTAPDPATGSWQAVNVASGDTEARMFAAARGALVFTEPQIGAWYAVTGTQIRPLNPSAIKSIGRFPITVAAYNDLISTRYNDKLPGTPYSTEGKAGGYDTTAAAPTHTYNDLILRSSAGAITLVGLAFLYHRRINRRPAATPRTVR
ncbi:hypothetical protein E0H75_18550 [Kribbella capetownensis]|uniref:Uncharacterized protein n=1 Tax=Kribbella capetownensis TaxID=1572659 RepID=A0A4R0JMZ8_9ACTN|nr:hypothetical protein [Kribbella capetownensis]TCC48591.1 hypothetical protein E0H75_18550 [Kribbella capetownensis]